MLRIAAHDSDGIEFSIESPTLGCVRSIDEERSPCGRRTSSNRIRIDSAPVFRIRNIVNRVPSDAVSYGAILSAVS